MNIAYGNIDFGPVELTGGSKAYSQDFELTKNLSREKANLTILFTAPGTYFLDDVSMRDNALLKNGTFDGDLSSWNVYINSPAADASKSVIGETGNKELDVLINDTGGNDDSNNWFVQLNQEKINLEYGKKYRLSVKMRSTIDRSVYFHMCHNGESDNNWDSYSGQEIVKLGSEYKTFTKEFVMEYRSDAWARFNITMGSVNGERIKTPHHVYVDDVVLEEIG